LTLEAYWEATRVEVEAALVKYLHQPPAAPAVVVDAMRYSLMAGGKRFRPLLTLAAADAIADAEHSRAADPRAMALPAACAIEMIHTYSLIHDDLPAMDDDTLRRGRPTLHVVAGDGIAILAGDGLHAEAFGLLAREPASNDPITDSRKLRVIRVIAAAAGPAGMVGGQAIDLQAVGAVAAYPAPPLDAEGLEAMHARKTGALIRASALCGAIMAGGDETRLVAIDRYAAEIGLAFQIVDDILDVEAGSEALGKTPGKDAAAGKPTYPALFGVEQSRAMAAACLGRATAALAEVDLSRTHLAGIARWVIDRRS
jgi:geranylgeranyl diphosphate synthase type II